MFDQHGSPARWGVGARTIADAGHDAALRAHMLRVYAYMTGGLAVTGLVALAVAGSPAALQLIFGTPLKWAVMLAPLGFVMFLSLRAHAVSAARAQALFWAFAAVMGLSLASVFLVFTGASIARVFFITAAMFAGTSLYGYTTRRDLSGVGSFMVMGLIGLVVASLVNLFLASDALQFAVSVIGVIVFTGLAAWDTQRIKEEFDAGHGTEANSKLAVLGALALYLSFINLFQVLLALLGQREE